MSNHLNDVIDIMKSGNGFVEQAHLTEVQMDRIEQTFINASKIAIAFDAGDVETINSFKRIDELIRLPYPAMWLENSQHIGGVKALFGQMIWNHSGTIQAHCFVRNANHKWMFFESWNLDGKKIHFGHCPNGIDTETASFFFHIASKFLSALNCTNINRIEHKPSEKLQKARAKRGKQPLFSYWTLEIDLPKSRAAGEDYGGTHASPRLHLRRGHPRQYAPGKYCWVQPCVVGNKAAGIVHKDYSVHA